MNTADTPSNKSSFFARLAKSFVRKPASREEIAELLQDAHSNAILDDEALEIMEGALAVSDQQVREIMVPRSKMTVIPESADIQEILELVIKSGHSRFPVVGESADDIKGILLAKELLPLALEAEAGIDLSRMIRPATIVPESKRLNVLLKEFREQRYHMAVVLDEYATVAGLVTIEDILEEIVGEIADETDPQDLIAIQRIDDQRYHVAALTPIEDFNEHFGAGLNEDEFDTVGGLVVRAFGHLPQAGESTTLADYQVTVLEGDERQIHLLEISPRTIKAD